MGNQLSFIEKQFPVSKVSKESYKERKSSQGQTITGLGKWWGRKPLILVRAAILGCLLPSSDDAKKDMEMFLKLLSMDADGLKQRMDHSFSATELYRLVEESPKFKKYLDAWFTQDGKKIVLQDGVDRTKIVSRLFDAMSYDEKISYCCRPEELKTLSSDNWKEINDYFDTEAHTLPEFVNQLSIKRYGHNLKVGDCFCGGGSIPFEAARIGCDVYASDLNPIAGMLTWADLNICGASDDEFKEITDWLTKAYNTVDQKIKLLGVEENEEGDRALSYLYCLETKCPECEWRVPLLPSFAVGIRAGKVIAKLKESKGKCFEIDIVSDVSLSDIKMAQNSGTVQNNALICPHCGKTTPISVLRHDTTDENGEIRYGLRRWKEDEYMAREDDVYQERLYAVRYEHIEDANGKRIRERYYCSPSKRDLKNEIVVKEIVSQSISNWQQRGLVPRDIIIEGMETARLNREQGWGYWHQLFNPRQLLVLSMLSEQVALAPTQKCKVAGILALNKCVNFGAKLCRWNPNRDSVADTYYNQALNTLMNYGTRSLVGFESSWFNDTSSHKLETNSFLSVCDARDVCSVNDLWITDPPYADAVNYHELSEFFLTWDKPHIQSAFPEWYTDSKRVLAVRGDDSFSNTMIDIYGNLAKHMPDNGMQIVMFTHSNPAVWAQLAVIMWKSGLRVTAAWNIATETDAVGLKAGNYVKGTVLLVLRKQTGDSVAFLDEINADIRKEVRSQIASMQELDDKEEPNFADPDYVLAAYAASLKVLTSFAEIEDLDLDFELSQAISNPSGSKIVSIIETAKKIAYDCVIPAEIDSYLWRDLTNAEKFYIKGLESEKHGIYQIASYQEFARGFSIAGYGQLMANERANTARLKTPFEMAGRSFNDVPDFENSLMRSIFQGIYVAIKEDMNPNRGLDFIKNDISDYWDKRETIKQLLSFLVDIKDISNMQPHWTESALIAEQLLAVVLHDSV